MLGPYDRLVSTSERDSQIQFAAALSTRRDAVAAADEACERALASAHATGASDLVLLHFTREHARHAEAIERVVHERLGAETVLGVSASGVVGGAMQVREAPGLSVLAGWMPGVDVHPFILQDLPKPPEDAGEDWAREHIAPVVGLDRSDARATLVLTDAFSVPLVRLLPSLAGARERNDIPILGGVASAGKAPGQNVLSLNGGIMNVGGVGVTLTGNIDVDCAVSQGCVGFGSNLVVTKCRGNVLLELSGRRAIDVVRETVLELDGEQRSRLGRGLFVGRVINEYKERFGRDDYLIRGIRGFDEQAGAVLTDDFFRVGQTIRLHYRDTKTAQADLGMLLDRERLRSEPAAALLLTSQGREAGPAGSPSHDAGAVARAFSQQTPGVHAAKGGRPYGGSPDHDVPLAGFEAAGEIGPTGDGVFLHSQSAVLAVIREGRAS